MIYIIFLVNGKFLYTCFLETHLNPPHKFRQPVLEIFVFPDAHHTILEKTSKSYILVWKFLSSLTWSFCKADSCSEMALDFSKCASSLSQTCCCFFFNCLDENRKKKKKGGQMASDLLGSLWVCLMIAAFFYVT